MFRKAEGKAGTSTTGQNTASIPTARAKRSRMRILVIEDDEALLRALAESFAGAGISCECCNTAAEATQLLEGFAYDAVVLDLGLPDEDGLTLLRRLRMQGNRLPVIVLTARSHPLARVEGLGAGADDYLGKPFLFAELVARLDAVLRRFDGRVSNTINYGGLVFDMDARTAFVGGELLHLSPREREVLEILLRRHDRPVTHAVIEDQLCGAVEGLSVNAIEVYVHRLRRKLVAANAQVTIENVRGVGYTLHTAP